MQNCIICAEMKPLQTYTCSVGCLPASNQFIIQKLRCDSTTGQINIPDPVKRVLPIRIIPELSSGCPCGDPFIRELLSG